MLRTLSVCLLACAFALCGPGCSDSSTTVPPGEDTGHDAGAGYTGVPADGGADAGHVALEGCDTTTPGRICAGAARRVLTPETFEKVRPELLSDHESCYGGGTTCGTLSKQKLLDLDKACRAGDAAKCTCPAGKAKCKWIDAYFEDTNGNGV